MPYCSSPRSFQADFGIDPNFAKLFPTGIFTSGPMKHGKGSSCRQTFTIRNGQFDFMKQTVKFDMMFDQDHPPEEFSGIHKGSGSDVTSVKGTIKVKPSWLRALSFMTAFLQLRRKRACSIEF
ncbi:hypothetical protein CPB84DRAFT_1755010 [Gymnopilus junonius]|uniref:Uncharacterized protein n=1 Tax=Gymnopilus junonius TaxID=109634 RepID=A0A9P5TFH0_GYMJU|nr:hypothetical protein CPB84DRAFT_1755010 [Gymnopilus junonius]